MKTSRWPTWRWPLGVAVVSLAGLLSALLGDGLWDTASWFALAVPIGVCAWFGTRRRRL